MKALKSTFVLGLAALFVVPGMTSAKTHTPVNGTIQGAGCVIKQTVHPLGSNEPKAALERDVVLQCDDGSYYFLPNLPRTLKLKYLNQEITISGELRDKSLIAHQPYQDKTDPTQPVYDWEKEMAGLNR